MAVRDHFLRTPPSPRGIFPGPRRTQAQNVCELTFADHPCWGACGLTFARPSMLGSLRTYFCATIHVGEPVLGSARTWFIHRNGSSLIHVLPSGEDPRRHSRHRVEVRAGGRQSTARADERSPVYTLEPLAIPGQRGDELPRVHLPCRSQHVRMLSVRTKRPDEHVRRRFLWSCSCGL